MSDTLTREAVDEIAVKQAKIAWMMDFSFPAGKVPGKPGEVIAEYEASRNTGRLARLWKWISSRFTWLGKKGRIGAGNGPETNASSDSLQQEQSLQQEWKHLANHYKVLGQHAAKETVWLCQQYAESGKWLWYDAGETTEHQAPLFYDRRRVCVSNPACKTVTVPQDKTEFPLVRRGAAIVTAPQDKKEPPPPPPLVRKGAAIGLSVLVIPSRGVGVATAWINGTPDDPGRLKHLLGALATRSTLFKAMEIFQTDEHATSTRSKPFKAIFKATGIFRRDEPDTRFPERDYPFLAVQLAEKEDFGDCKAETLWGWLTGGYEDETDKKKKAAVANKANLSHRSYEKLFMTWTDALAVYSSEGCNDDHYQLAMCRAAQLFEYCILVRRLFRSEAGRAAKLFQRVKWWLPPPVSSAYWKANGLLEAFTQAELDLVTAPPVDSVEARRLVDQALKDFGIPDLIDDTRNSYELLDRRLQWIRAQWLAILAVVVFIASTFVVPFIKP